MLAKILLTAGIVIGALLALRAVGRATDTRISREEEEARAEARRKLRSEDFAQCEACGAYKPRGEPCACGAGQ